MDRGIPRDPLGMEAEGEFGGLFKMGGQVESLLKFIYLT